MAKVYTGRVEIPAEQFGEYLKLMGEVAKQKEPFRQQLTQLNEDFYSHLLTKFTQKTANKHSYVVSLFIEFICKRTDVMSFEEITRGMVNTHFKQWWKRKVWDSTKPEELTVALKKFFVFLAAEKGMVNEKAFKGLQ